MGRLPQRSRVVIIGGGIIGCSIAYHLTLRGEADVVLLERRQFTCGTTWHAAGLIAQLRATLNLTRLSRYSAELYQQLAAETGVETGYKCNGAIGLAGSPERMVELRRQAGLAELFGVPVEIIDRARIADLYPIADLDGVVGGVWLPTDAQLNPVDVTMALIAGARRRGARLFENVRVDGLVREGDRVVGVTTSEGEIAADRVVLAAGMWTRDFAAAHGVTVPLQAAEHFYVVTEPIPGLPADLPVLRDADSTFYAKEDAGKLLIGGFEPVAKPWGLDGIPESFCFDQLPDDFEHFAPVLEQAARRVPALQSAGLKLFFNGPESFTPDNRYILGEAPECPGLFVATGFNSIGIQSAGGAGKAVADWIIDGHPGLDLWDVDIRRFAPFQRGRSFLRDRTVESPGLLYAMHWPFRQYETARGIRRSILHERLARAGACFGEACGWERADWFAGPGEVPERSYSFSLPAGTEEAAREHRAARTEAALFDRSALTKLLLQGADAAAVLDRLSTSRMDMAPGASARTLWLNGRGGIEADVVVTRVAGDAFLILSEPETQTHNFHYLRSAIGPDERCTVTDVTSAFACLTLAGPNTRAILDALMPGCEAGAGGEVQIGYAPGRIIPVGDMGETAFALLVATEFAPSAFDHIMEAGAPLGLILAGHHALKSLRIEAGHRQWGYELDTDTTPLEAGIGHLVDWDKAEFAGRGALLQHRQAPSRRHLVQLRLTVPGAMLFHDEIVWRNDRRAGRITSAMYGHSLGAAVGFAYVDAMPGPNGDDLLAGAYEIEVAGRRFAAVASLDPMYVRSPDRQAA